MDNDSTDETKPIVRSILLSLGREATQYEFEKEYETLEGQPFSAILAKSQKSFLEFMESMPDVARLCYKDNRIIVQHVSNEASVHMNHLTINKFKKRRDQGRDTQNRSYKRYTPTFSNRFQPGIRRPNFPKPLTNSAGVKSLKTNSRFSPANQISNKPSNRRSITLSNLRSRVAATASSVGTSNSRQHLTRVVLNAMDLIKPVAAPKPFVPPPKPVEAQKQIPIDSRKEPDGTLVSVVLDSSQNRKNLKKIIFKPAPEPETSANKEVKENVVNGIRGINKTKLSQPQRPHPSQENHSVLQIPKDDDKRSRPLQEKDFTPNGLKINGLQQSRDPRLRKRANAPLTTPVLTVNKEVSSSTTVNKEVSSSTTVNKEVSSSTTVNKEVSSSTTVNKEVSSSTTVNKEVSSSTTVNKEVSSSTTVDQERNKIELRNLNTQCEIITAFHKWEADHKRLFNEIGSRTKPLIFYRPKIFDKAHKDLLKASQQRLGPGMKRLLDKKKNDVRKQLKTLDEQLVADLKAYDNQKLMEKGGNVRCGNEVSAKPKNKDISVKGASLNYKIEMGFDSEGHKVYKIKLPK